MKDQEDAQAFNLMVFPKQPSRQRISFKEVVSPGKRYVIVESTITDKNGANYIFREPVTPAEIGQLYRLFFQENFPKTISLQDNYFVVVDENEKVIGGVCYKFISSEAAQLDGTIMATHYSGKGIGSQMIELFTQRMDSIGIRVIKTHFYSRSFFLKKGFNVNTRWGALVKFIGEEK
jgi:predicted GNAT family acetyltransferase